MSAVQSSAVQSSAVRRAAMPAALGGTALGLGAGALAHALGHPELGDRCWDVTALAVAVLVLVQLVRSLREGRFGVDVLALLALVSAVATGEHVAAALIALMYVGGQTLEARASARAERDLRALLEHAPVVAHRMTDGPRGSVVEDIDVGDVRAGHLLVVRPGKVVPVDGRVRSERAEVDASALTGESLPITIGRNDVVQSGTVAVGAAFELCAIATAEESAFAGVVRLVEHARLERAPFVRLADRIALAFIPAALVLAGLSWWWSGDVTNAVAVIVVASPCPLILAAPVALVSGMSRTARSGVVVKDGGVLERLAVARVAVLDKTGTVTRGRPAVSAVITDPGWTSLEVLMPAAALEQASNHVLADAVVRAGMDEHLDLPWPIDVREELGGGVEGRVAGRRVRVGRLGWMLGEQRAPSWSRTVRRRVEVDGSLSVFVEIDGAVVGAVLFDDPVRPDARATLRRLRGLGVERIVLATGDRSAVARSVGELLGLDEVAAERSPAEKVAMVVQERRNGTTLMVGDGVNDAPALAAADIGVALGARGSSASSEAADVVITVDRFDRLADGIAIAQRAVRIARQSAIVGMGLSAVAMIVAATGRLAPAWGALVQEAIDVLVIFNATRVLLPAKPGPRLSGAAAELSRALEAEHRLLWPGVLGLRAAADALEGRPPPSAFASVRRELEFLVDDLLPHELVEEGELYPAVAQALGGADPTATMSREHTEIAHLVRVLGSLLEQVDVDDPDPVDVRELRRVLVALDAVLRLHFAQEDETYLVLGRDDVETTTGPLPGRVS